MFDDMLTTAIQRDIISFSAVISACEKATEWQQAIGFIDVMPEFQIEPNLIAFNAAISSCEKKLRCFEKKIGLSVCFWVLGGGFFKMFFFIFYPENLGKMNPCSQALFQTAVERRCDVRGFFVVAKRLCLEFAKINWRIT